MLKKGFSYDTRSSRQSSPALVLMTHDTQENRKTKQLVEQANSPGGLYGWQFGLTANIDPHCSGPAGRCIMASSWQLTTYVCKLRVACWSLKISTAAIKRVLHQAASTTAGDCNRQQGSHTNVLLHPMHCK
jgi:hypothetical protein